jgi:hypothetical protein
MGENVSAYRFAEDTPTFCAVHKGRVLSLALTHPAAVPPPTIHQVVRTDHYPHISVQSLGNSLNSLLGPQFLGRD